MKNKNIMKHALAAIVSAIVIPLSLTAQETTRAITPSEAIQLSLQNNKTLKISKAKIDEADASVKEAEDRRLPEASASAMYLLFNNPNIDIKSKGNSGSGSGGGTTEEKSPAVMQAALGMVNMSLPIYTGNQIKYGIESSRYLAEAKRLDAEYNKAGVIENTLNACRNLFRASQTVNLLQDYLDQENKRVKDFTNLEKNGLLARNDLLKASLQASNAELALLEAQNNLTITTVNMNLMLGLPEKTKLVLDTTGFRVPVDTKGLGDWETLAFQNRKDMASLQQQYKAAGTNIKAIAGEKLPFLSLTGGYVNGYFENVATITNAVNIGVSAKYNISSLWKTNSKIDKAKAVQQQIEYSQQLLDDNIRLDVSKAYEEYILTQKKVEVYAKAIEQADENYKINQNKYDNGLATLTDLLDASVAQLRANLNQALGKADIALAYVQLQKSAGVLSEKL